MSALEAFGEFAGGVTRGAPQGLSLYEQYTDLQTKQKERYNQEAVTKELSAMQKAGEFEKDKIGAARKAASLYLKYEQPEAFAKWSQTADSWAKAKFDEHALDAMSRAKTDPGGAVGALQKAADTMQTGEKFEWFPNPAGGGRMIITRPGEKPAIADYTNMDEFDHDVMRRTLPQVEGAAKFLEGEREEKKQKATEVYQGRMAGVAEAGLEFDEMRAQAAQVQAGASATQAQTEAQTAPKRLELLGAQVENEKLKASGGTVYDIMDKMYADPTGLEEGGNTTNTKPWMSNFALGIQSATGVNPQQAAAAAIDIQSLSPDQLRSVGATDPSQPLTLPNGMPLPNTPQMRNYLAAIGLGKEAALGQ